jgi:hypothetical protein
MRLLFSAIQIAPGGFLFPQMCQIWCALLGLAFTPVFWALGMLVIGVQNHSLNPSNMGGNFSMSDIVDLRVTIRTEGRFR